MKRFFFYLLSLTVILASAFSISNAGLAIDKKEMINNKIVPINNLVPKVIYPDRIEVNIPKADWYIFPMITPRINQEQSQSLAKRLLNNRTEGMFNKSEMLLQYSDPKDASTFFSQDMATGDISFSNQLSAYFGDNVPKLPNEEMGPEIATKFLKEYNLYPKNSSELKVIHIGGLRSTSAENDKAGIVIDKLRTITFGRIINNIAVQGGSSKIIVHIGDGGKVVGMNYKWRETGKAIRVKPTDIKTISQAKEEITKKLSSEWNQASSIQISKIALVYYDGGSKYIQPAYMFEANIMEGEDKYSYMGAIAALKQPPEGITLEKLPPEAYRQLKSQKSIKPTESPNKEQE